MSFLKTWIIKISSNFCSNRLEILISNLKKMSFDSKKHIQSLIKSNSKITFSNKVVMESQRMKSSECVTLELLTTLTNLLTKDGFVKWSLTMVREKLSRTSKGYSFPATKLQIRLMNKSSGTTLSFQTIVRSTSQKHGTRSRRMRIKLLGSRFLKKLQSCSVTKKERFWTIAEKTIKHVSTLSLMRNKSGRNRMTLIIRFKARKSIGLRRNGKTST